MQPERLLLVRHGETDWNRDRRIQGHSDVPLNDTGRRQAIALAKRLEGWPIDALHASDLRRAAETAAILGAATGHEARLSANWREISFGTHEGRSDPTSFTEMVRHAHETGGENYETVRARLEAGYRTLCEQHAGQHVLLVGHGGTLRALIASLIGLPPENIENLSLRGNASLSIVEFGSGRPKLTLLNDTSHCA